MILKQCIGLATQDVRPLTYADNTRFELVLFAAAVVLTLCLIGLFAYIFTRKEEDQ